MKKLLCCLLALMLPFGALADGLSASLTWTLWPEGMIEFLHALTNGQRYPLMEEWLGELSQFTSGFTLATAADTDSGYGYLTLRYGDEDLYAFDVTVTDRGTVMRQSVLPDMPLLLSPDNLYADPSALLPEEMNSVPWDGVLETLYACASRWAAAMETAKTTGHYAGDAYEGGAYRTTLRFDDRDLALLMDMLLDADWPEAFTSLMERRIAIAGIDPDDARSSLRDELRKTALNNRYRYVLHLVSGGNREPVGLSLIAYLEDQQVATLSVGAPHDGVGFALVLGWGLEGENVYLSSQTYPEDASGLCLSGALWRDRARARSIQAVAANSDNLLMRLDLYDLTLEEADVWKLAASGDALGDMAVDVLLYHRENDGGSDNSVMISLNDQQLALVNLDFCPTASLAAPDLTDLELLDMSALSMEEALVMAETAGLAVTEVGVRLFKLMPVRLLTLPLNIDFFNPTE